MLLDPGITISVYLGKSHLTTFKHIEWVHLKCNLLKCDEEVVVFNHSTLPVVVTILCT